MSRQSENCVQKLRYAGSVAAPSASLKPNRIPAKIAIYEIGWRWAFGVGTLLMIAIAARQLLASVPLSNGDIASFRSREPLLIAGAVLHIWEHSGAHVVAVCALVAIAASVLWMLLASAGRILTLDPLLTAESKRNHAGVFAIHFLRLIWAWVAFVACIAVVVLSSYIAVETASNPDKPNLPLYLLLVFLGLPVVLIVWSVANWYMSLAPVFCLQEGERAFSAIGSAREHVRRRRSEFARASSVYAAPRFIALVLLIVFAAIAASSLAPRPATVVIIFLSLAYFAFADFLYVARLAKYVALFAVTERPGAAPQLVTPAPAEVAN